MEERGVQVDHATLNRWIIDYSPFIAAEAKKRKRNVATSWRMDEIYVKSKANGSTCIVLSTNSAIPSIRCYLNSVAKWLLPTTFFKQATIDGIETAHMIRKNSCQKAIFRLISSLWR
jgi:putative transposase